MSNQENRTLSVALTAMAWELGCTEAEAAREMYSQYCEAAGFTGEPMQAAINSMSDAQILAACSSL